MSMVFANDARSRRRGKQAALTNQQSADTIGGGHLDDRLQGISVKIASIAPQNEDFSLYIAQHVEHGLDKVFQIVGLHENFYFFPEARSAGFLILKGSCFAGFCLHRKMILRWLNKVRLF